MNITFRFFSVFMVAAVFMTANQSLAMRRAYSEPLHSKTSDLNILMPALSLGLQYFYTQKAEPSHQFSNREPLNRGVFLVSNEIGSENNAAQLRHFPNRGNTGIGVSALFNLELFAARFHQGVTSWIMIDPAPEVQLFWRTVCKSFENARDLDSMFASLQIVLKNNMSHYFTPEFLSSNGITSNEQFEKWISHRLTQAKRRLSAAMAQMDFAQLRTLVTKNLMLVPTDLADTNSIKALTAYMQNRELTLDTVYVSNVHMRLPGDLIDGFRANIEQLRLCGRGKGLSYLVEALPKNAGESARLLSKKCYQQIYYC